jgi:PAS domain S-box-containing protein
MTSSFDGRSEMEHERRAAVMLDGMDQFVALLNPKGDILEVNRAALEGAGQRIEEIRGKPFWTARWWQVSEDIRQELQAAIRCAAAGEFVRYEVDIYGAQSGRVPITIDFTLQPISGESGEVEYLLAEGRNITEFKRVENLGAESREASRIDSLQAGADDFVVKPFSARERVAPVNTQVKMSSLRQEAAPRKESEYQFRIFANAAPAILWTTEPDASCSFLSRSWSNYTGQNEEEALGFGWLEPVHPEDREEARRGLLDANIRREPFSLDYRLRRADGEYRWAIDAGQPRFDVDGNFAGFIGSVIDIHERKQAERVSELLSAIVDSSDDAIISKDLNGVITSWNKGAERLFGYTAEEAVGRPVTMLIPAERLDEEPKILEQLKRGERVEHFETIRMRKDGSQLDISLTISPVKDNHGRIVGASKVARDISDRKLTEQALREYAEQLKDADQRKDEFLATLAHELRNPLAPILNAVGLLKQPSLTAEHFQLAREIAESQLNQMVRLVDDLLDISRISRGKIDLKKERVTLKAILDQALETSRPHVNAAGHQLSVTLPPRDVYLDGDLVRLAQVVSNLINNACKYSANNGKIEIKADVETEIENSGNQRDAANGSGKAVKESTGELVLSVKDTGIGIAPEHMPRLFKLFSQVDSALERSQGGLGIGLSLVRSLVEQHGGSVEARSEGLGKGSEFIVRLPTVPASTEESTMGSGDEPVLNMPFRSERILVVDDNKPQAQSLALLLNTMGFDVRSVYNAKSALSILDEFTPQVALIDIGLPDLNGCELARRLRELPALKGITLIAQSGWGRDADREAARQAGFDHYLIKPINHQVLQTLLLSE